MKPLLALAMALALALTVVPVTDARQVACVGQPSCYQAAHDWYALACVQPTTEMKWICVDFVCACMPIIIDGRLAVLP